MYTTVAGIVEKLCKNDEKQNIFAGCTCQDTVKQGYIVRFGQCSVFLIPINKRRRWKLVLSLTDGALYCS
jgi:hypothetical protein